MKFRSWNQLLLTVSLAALLSAPGCRPESERRLTLSTRRQLDLAREQARAWQTEVRDSAPSTTATISFAYLERLRLGLSSPFRLIDYALSDPRLDQPTRERVAYALLAAIQDGQAYEIDPIALDRAGAAGVNSWPGFGQHHLDLIEKTVRDARQPRAAEAGLRMGYAIGAAEGIVSREAPKLAGMASALLVDRELARRDARQLLAQATATQTALQPVHEWRMQRGFQVELPRLGPLPLAEEAAAIQIAKQVVTDLRKQSLEIARHRLPEVSGATAAHERWSDVALERLGAAEQRLDAPPQTPIVLAARQLSRESSTMPWLGRAQRLARAHFGVRALNEESFVVEYARLRAESPHDAAPARAALQAAVAMRAYAQESVWYPGMSAPSQRQLQERYGLASITFDHSVPSAWRPYYRRVLSQSLADLQRVLPALRLDGLRVHFGSVPASADALAIHEPAKRRLVLPPLTSAGTIAHEIAHDVDYQMAVRRYRVRGDYATDRAARQNNDALAVQLRSLTAASLTNPASERLNAHARRPAEVFARHVDWYVAVSLARAGRRNGYLTSVQDELITGYGTVRAPDVAGAAGDALMTILEELAPVYRDQRDGFKALYGSVRLPRAYDLVRRVVEERRSGLAPEAQLAALRAARDSAFALLNGSGCSAALSAPAELQQARRELVLLATQARARGIGAGALNLLGELTSVPEPPARSPFQLMAEACSSSDVLQIKDEG
jgi:hypothetical protein